MENKNDYSYYSNKLKKVFNSIEDLKAAEKEADDKVSRQSLLTEKRKSDAKAVEDAYKEYVKTMSEANKTIEEAKKKYIDLRNKFVKDYGYFHMTYSDNNCEDLSLSLYENFINTWRDFFNF